jgi:hypothetical protein
VQIVPFQIPKADLAKSFFNEWTANTGVDGRKRSQGSQRSETGDGKANSDPGLIVKDYAYLRDVLTRLIRGFGRKRLFFHKLRAARGDFRFILDRSSWRRLILRANHQCLFRRRRLIE